MGTKTGKMVQTISATICENMLKRAFEDSGIPTIDLNDPTFAPGWSWDDSFGFKHGYVTLHFELVGERGTCGKRHDNGPLPDDFAGGALVAREPDERRDVKLDVTALVGKPVSASLLVLAASVAKALPFGGWAMAGPLLVKRGIIGATVELAENGAGTTGTTGTKDAE